METDVNERQPHPKISVNNLHINSNKFYSEKVKQENPGKNGENPLDVTLKKDIVFLNEDLYIDTKISNVLNDVQNEDIIINSSRSAHLRISTKSFDEHALRKASSTPKSDNTNIISHSKDGDDEIAYFENSGSKFVDNYKYYLHCSKCLLIVSGEGEINYEMKLFIKISNLIKENSNFVNRSEISDLIQCRECTNIIGVVIKHNKTDGKTSSKFLLKNKITIKNEKCLIIGLLSLKPDKLEIIHKTLTKIFNESDVGQDEVKIKPKINLIEMRQTKDSLQNFKLKSENSIDILFIIHKAEGRVFLLGRNGFYNKVYEALYKKLSGNIYFLLLYKNIFFEDEDGHLKDDQQFQEESIGNLINKGDQKELQQFKEENKIICLDDDKFEVDVSRRSKFFEEMCYKRFCYYGYEEDKSENNNENTNTGKKSVDQPNLFISNDDQLLIDHLIKKSESNIEDGGNRFKCFVL